MPRFMIEREIPEIGSADHDVLTEAAGKSNAVLNDMKAERKNVQWQHSYVTENRTFCIYLADDEALVNEHAERSGFPASKVTLIKRIIDPVTAEGVR